MRERRQSLMDRRMMTAYLLGTLPEADQLALAERYFTDEELFDQLLAVETDLVDQYVRGALGADAARRLENYLERLPDGPNKIAVAQALMKVAEATQSTAAARPPRWWSRLPLPTWKWPPALVYSFVAMLLVAVGGGWLGSRYWRRGLENEELRAEVTVAPETRTKIASPQSESRPPVVEQSTPVKQSAPPPARRRVLPAALLRLELTPAFRDAPTPDKLIIKPGVRVVALVAPMAGPETYTGYHAVLQTTAGKLIWEQQRAQTARPRRGLDLRVPARQLPPDSYKLTLRLQAANGREVARDYYFIVERE